FLAEHAGLAIVVGAETGFVLTRDPDTVLARDAAVVLTHRLPAADKLDGYVELPPDLAVEIVPPNDRWSTVIGKVEAYLAAGTRLVWVVEPRRRAVRIYTPGGAAVRLQAAANDVLEGEPVLVGFRLALSDLFMLG